MNYPEMKADLDLCYKQLFEICRGERNLAVMRIPHTEKDFDMQFSAAFDELAAYRKLGTVAELKALKENQRIHPQYMNIMDLSKVQCLKTVPKVIRA